LPLYSVDCYVFFTKVNLQWIRRGNRKKTETKADADTLTAKILECPVCYDTLQPPIHQCYNGHLLCHTCIEKVQECPVCREDMPLKRIRNRAVEELTKNHEYKCRETGCPAKLKPADIESHKLFECQYASLPFCELLGIPTCKVLTTRGEICNHMSSAHGVPILENEKAQIHYLCVKSEQNGSKICWRPCIFQCFNQTFFLKCEFNPVTQSLSWTPLVHSRDEIVKNIRITLKVTSVSQDTTVEWKGPAHPLFEKTDKETAALVLPLKNYGSLFRSDSNEDTMVLCVAFEYILKTESISDLNLVKVESMPIFSDIFGTFSQTGLHEAVRLNPIHFGVTCDICSRTDIAGVRFKCLECEDYDICEHCERTSNAHDHHLFARLPAVHSQIRVADILSRCLGYNRRRGYRGHHLLGGPSLQPALPRDPN